MSTWLLNFQRVFFSGELFFQTPVSAVAYGHWPLFQRYPHTATETCLIDTLIYIGRGFVGRTVNIENTNSEIITFWLYWWTSPWNVDVVYCFLTNKAPTIIATSLYRCWACIILMLPFVAAKYGDIWKYMCKQTWHATNPSGSSALTSIMGSKCSLAAHWGQHHAEYVCILCGAHKTPWLKRK